MNDRRWHSDPIINAIAQDAANGRLESQCSEDRRPNGATLMTATNMTDSARAGVLERLRTCREMLFHADALAIQPVQPNQVETTQITTRESGMLQDALLDAIRCIDTRATPPVETEMCDACNGSGFGVADTYCGKCGGAGGYPATPQVEMPALTAAAGAIIDCMTGGDFDWRSRLDESDFLESGDWLTALEYARAALAAASLPDETTAVDALTYRQMHEDAVALGYPSILEALEGLERLKASDERVRVAKEALERARGLIGQMYSGKGWSNADVQATRSLIDQAIASLDEGEGR